MSDTENKNQGNGGEGSRQTSQSSTANKYSNWHNTVLTENADFINNTNLNKNNQNK